jgi:hypothetical protein
MTEVCTINFQFLQLLMHVIIKLLNLFLVFNLGGFKVSLHLSPDARLNLLKLIFGSVFAIQAMLKVRNCLVQLCFKGSCFTWQALRNDMGGPREFVSHLLIVRFMLLYKGLVFLP